MRSLTILIVLSAVSGIAQQLKVPELPAISLARIAGFCSCPSYVIDIMKDGKVIYTPYPLSPAMLVTFIPKEKVQELTRRFDEARFFEMGGWAPHELDAPAIKLTASIGTAPYTFVGRVDVPQFIQLADLVEEAVESWRWVSLGPLLPRPIFRLL